jgi:predicted outer membrane repeat protein
MNPKHRLDRLQTIAAAALPAFIALVMVFGLAVPSLAQAVPASPSAAKIIYVDKDATGPADGTTWANAYLTIQDALSVAVGAEIWVAEGVYYPDEGTGQTDGDRTATFELKQGITLYGGFDGTEIALEERDWVNNVTVLSGDLDHNDATDANGVVLDPENIVGTDNCYHVATADEVSLSAKLDGFTVTAGLADSTDPDDKGAGIYSIDASPTLANLIVRGNLANADGGGMFSDNSGPSFTNVTFRNNEALVNGGGFSTTASGGAIANLTFDGNEAGANGGGMYLTTSVGHTLSSLTFLENSAEESGGGLYVQSGVLSTLSGSDFNSNTAENGGGLYVDSSLLNLTGVDFMTNDASDRGGGLFAQLGTHSFNNVTFTGNHATTAGGGFFCSRNALSLTASLFTANTSALGAGMYVDGQALSAASVTMSNTEFIANVANGDGGGLYVVDSPQGTLSSVSFSANRAASGNGGGMFLANASPYALSSTEFDLNEAISGGGMYVSASNPALTAVTFTDNQAQVAYADTIGGGGLYLTGGSDATLSRCTFSGNSAATGGGMYISSGKPALTNVSFIGNQAGDGIAGSGGGLWNTLGSPTLIDVLFGGNTATLDGGGMSTGGAGSNLVLTNLTFSGNAAGRNGGGLHTTSPNVTIHNTVIWNNQDQTGLGTADASLSGAVDLIEYSLIEGLNPLSGIGNLDGTDALNDPDFVFPVAPSAAPSTAGIYSVKYGSPIVDVGNNAAIAVVTLDLAGNPRIYNGTVDLGAYELPLACPPETITRLYVNRTETLGNTGVDWDNALKNLRDALTLADNCAGIVEIWVAKGVYRPDEGVGMVPDSRTETYPLLDGVAVYGGFAGTENDLTERVWETNPTVLSGDVDSNDVATGGVVQNPGNIVGANSYHVVIAGSVSNTAILDGFTITAGQANGSEPDDHGAGLYNNASSPTLANLIFIGNFAGNGGGLANLSGSNPSMTDIQFKNNMALSTGGGAYNEASTPTLSDVIFTGNFAAYGAGLANLNSSNPSLTGVQFTSNTAGTAGGGIYNQASSPTLTYAIVSGNSAPRGAAIYNDASAPTLINALLSGNASSLTGAGIYNTGSGPVLINVTVAGNRAGTTAGGMFNTADSHPGLHNSIFWDNRDATGTGTASATIHNDDLDSEPDINYSLVQALSGITHIGDNNLDRKPWFTTPLDPILAPSTAGDFTLGIFSPAIDAGDNAANATLTDLAGGARVINDIIDLGPYEAPYVPIYPVYLPIVLRNYP